MKGGRKYRALVCGAWLGLLLCSTLWAKPVEQDSAGRWTINMRDADIRDFTEQIASISGQTLVLDPRVKGQVTVISEAPLTLSEVYQLFLSVMSTHGYAVVTQGNQAQVVPDIEARSIANSPTGRGPETLETRVLQVQQTLVSELLPLIRPLVPQHGHLAAIPSSNSLIVSDKRANIERLIALIAQVDRASSDDSVFYNLRYAWAGEVAATLNKSLRQKAGTTSAQVIADTRTNRLLLLGPPKARERLLKLAQQLDTPPVRSANTRVIRLRHADAKELSKTLGELSEQLRGANTNTAAPVLIRADEGLNALILMAEPDFIARLEEVVHQLDVPRAQVLVEAAIVEMSGNISEALGVQWALGGAGKDFRGGTNFADTGLSVGTLLGAIRSKASVSLPEGAIVRIGSDNFSALITALSANSNSNLLSTPSLLTLDNQQAEILVGQNVPFQTGSYTTDAAGSNNPFTTIKREDVGVTLKVTPHINDGGTLRLVIEQEISSIAPSTGTASQAVDLVTNKRLLKTTVLADNGQVIVLGGLIQDDVVRSESKVPLLGDVPLLGRMFRSSKEVKEKRNLMVFLRPSVVRDGDGLVSLSQEKYQSLQQTSSEQGAPRLLPKDPKFLFERDTDSDPEPVNLRPAPSTALPSQAAQPYAAPVQLGLDTAPTPSEEKRSALSTQRFSVILVEGSSESFMRELIAQHPKEPLKIQHVQRNRQDWYRVFYGNYPRAELAERALRNMPTTLSRYRARVVAL